MKVLLVTPAPPGSRRGNRVTARRWARILRGLGHRVSVAEALDQAAASGEAEPPPELLLALHAARSADSVVRYRRARPDGRVIVALTGTDLYRDLAADDPGAQRSLELADLLVGLHPLVAAALPEAVRPRVRAILQSVELPPGLAPEWCPPAPEEPLRVCVAGHLRAVKDPFRTVLALRRLPAEAAIRVDHLGGALEPGTAEEARRLEELEPRYRWHGERSHEETLEVLARSHVAVVSSRMEGGPNVLSEALALELPVLATTVPGCVGLLGPDHPGLFPPEDTGALAELLRRARRDGGFLEALHRRSRTLASRLRPERERDDWRDLLAELRDGSPPGGSRP